MTKADWELTKADWIPYFGNNYEKIDRPKVIAFGSVSFKRHLDKPLTQALWEDLIHRFCISGMCIYKPGDLQWTIGWSGGHCIINLNENDKVEDIYLSPYTTIYLKEEHHESQI